MVATASSSSFRADGDAGGALDIAKWAASVESDALKSSVSWADSQSAKLKSMEEAKERLVVSEEMHAELDELITECLFLEDERSAAEARVRDLKLSLQVEKEKAAQIANLNGSGTTSALHQSSSHSGAGQSSSMSAGGNNFSGLTEHQEFFNEHVRGYFATISQRLGLDIDVLHEPGANDSAMPITEESCQYRLTFRNLGQDKSRCFTATIKLASRLQVLEVSPPLDSHFLDALTESTAGNHMSLSRFVVGLRRAFLARYN
mmetsp:Transcript_18240/g.45603  ORF Transcript_18240/g.45603 Transcript_18240/m.45603 type:complete len:261 (-) Transcript_18240:506-1288(-)|eukprot:CAMPEP_0178991604 /NCGR_PEP_ID=MMETSP0795-20121207/5627_1 /TAXON_ID=88552 /ORGANISM="Amoebophrya sp., Strain Ameob2" /LENGTH=260 /DNA_ID=CAMNT_0020683345 /DNA_START=149 /DNA_END=931 /DNA_ORIENTATION=+